MTQHAETLILLGIAGLLALAIYFQRRELALGLLAGLVAASIKALLELDRRADPPLKNPPPVVETERTAEKVQDEVQQDSRTPHQLELDLEREFGHRPRDKL